MASRRLKPYRQGRLDGLCGLYALINALRLLCPRLDDDDCERTFCALLRALERQGCSLLNVIHRGLTRRELFRLIGPWQRFSAREIGVILTVSRLKVSDPTLGKFWRGLCRALDGKGVAIVGLDGAERHWTVAYAATPRTLRVADSCGLQLIARAQCTVGRTSLRYRVQPSDVLVIKGERSCWKGARRQGGPRRGKVQGSECHNWREGCPRK